MLYTSFTITMIDCQAFPRKSEAASLTGPVDEIKMRGNQMTEDDFGPFGRHRSLAVTALGAARRFRHPSSRRHLRHQCRNHECTLGRRS